MKDKQPLYDLMNARVELKAYEAELHFRLKHERPKRDAKAAIREQMRSVSKKLRYNARDYSRLCKKLTKQASRLPKPGHQLGWLILLIAVLGLGIAAVILFGEQIDAFFDKIWSFITSPFGGNE